MNSTDLPDALWRKSSYSNGQANCVELAIVGHEHKAVAVRDSKSPGGPSLTFALPAWQQFAERVQAARDWT